MVNEPETTEESETESMELGSAETAPEETELPEEEVPAQEQEVVAADETVSTEEHTDQNTLSVESESGVE